MTIFIPAPKGALLSGVLILENVEHCGGKPEQAVTEILSLRGGVTHHVNHPPTCTSIYHSQAQTLSKTCMYNTEGLDQVAPSSPPKLDNIF